MRTKLIAVLVMLFCFSVLFANDMDDWYQNKPIRSITFQGLQNVTRSELDGLFSRFRGKPYTDEIYWEILQTLFGLDYFDDITPLALPGDENRTSIILEFQVVEKPVLKEIRFRGNAKFRSADLLDQIALKERDIFNDLKVRLDERAIRDFYLGKGYANVRVQSQSIVNPDKSITLEFHVTEGKQSVVESIEFQGNRVMASRTLRSVLSLKQKAFLVPGTFTEAALETDRAALLTYYTERGYVDAAIENIIRVVDTETDQSKNLISLTFVIREGDQFTYGGTQIEGNQLFGDDELLARMRIKEGDVLNLTRVTQGFHALADLYFENGFTSNIINRQESRDNERKRISYLITIVERERSHIENIVLVGNEKTKDYVILREMIIEPGDIFSKSRLMTSLRNLYNTRYFSMVAPDVVQGSEEDLVDVVFYLEEQSTASVQFGLTFSGVSDADTFPLSVFFQWEDKNFLGNGQTLSAELNASPDTQSLKLGFAENWFLGTPLTVGFNLSLAHKRLYAFQDALAPIFGDDDYDDSKGKVPPDPFSTWEEYMNSTGLDDAFRMEYERWEIGFGTSTGYRWFPAIGTVTLRGGVSFSLVQNMYDAVLFRPADKKIRDNHGKWNWSNSVWTKLSIDDRDLNFDPSTGWFASQQLTLYGLIPSLENEYFYRADTKAEGYLKLLDYPVTENWNLKFVLGGYTGFSFAEPVGSSIIGDNNLLFIDGMFNGRGWGNLYSSVRGKALLSHWLELRMPLAPGVLAADFFVDAVAVKDSITVLSSLHLNDYYFSFGPSLRFSIPQFPLRLLFANTFRVQDGKLEWEDGKGPNWKFVLSFNIPNL